MILRLRSIAILTTCVCYVSLGQAASPIVIKGSKFFDSVTREQFFIKGVAYQPRPFGSDFIDPLSRPSDCARDFAMMHSIGLNTVRVYQVDPFLNHDECMRILEDYGMYLLLDLASPRNTIIRTSPEYNIDIWNGVRSTVDAFKNFNNVLGFFIGNEVSNDKLTTPASAYVKALLRDTKAYIRQTSPRQIPVGYANNDDPMIRLQIQAYFNCGNDAERIDFFGINLYEWCGSSTSYATSGYADRTADVAQYSVPVFLSEYGCNLVSPRTFPEVQSIYGPDMTGIWSGGVVYEWSQEENNYGLVRIQGDNSIQTLPDFDHFKDALMAVKPLGVSMDQYNEVGPASACPERTEFWETSERLPPTPSGATCDCMMSTLSCTAAGLFGSDDQSLGDHLNVICGLVSCNEIAGNGAQGIYGRYSSCSPIQKLSYIYNKYYHEIGHGEASACYFDGKAKLVQASRPSDEGCGALMRRRHLPRG
ncbi:1,3-beta-glucanosyltransferase gas1 [Lunasporangiospora selenospora]|uniref:1,3-beta-glucanosyltransferase n=1 Tax=Lunasporangiospora selenospora TaxID=979761 RepID=A0A9P6KIT1_9FUNG|nr:1,3-beta-glucanosyltransferase gas1 [Lunasporangiospora selenospora]